MRKSIVEAIGTFFLCLVFLLSRSSGLGASTAAVAVASVVMVFLYAGSHVSGGHYNPAVSLAVWVRGRLATRDLCVYCFVQLVAASLAVSIYKLFPPAALVPAPQAAPQVILLAEGLFTFVWASTVLNVSTARNTSGNSYFGLAVGASVLASMIAVGEITGALLNPSVLLSCAVAGVVPWSLFVIYLIAHALGAIVAGVVFKFVNPLD